MQLAAKPQRIIGRISEKVDYGTDIKVVAEWNGTRLTWTPGHNSWEDRSTGYTYKVGFYSFQSESGGDYFERIRHGFDIGLTPSNSAPDDFADPCEIPKLNKEWVSRMVKIIREKYEPNFPEFEYKRGKTFAPAQPQ